VQPASVSLRIAANVSRVLHRSYECSGVIKSRTDPRFPCSERGRELGCQHVTFLEVIHITCTEINFKPKILSSRCEAAANPSHLGIKLMILEQGAPGSAGKTRTLPASEPLTAVTASGNHLGLAVPAAYPATRV
jgi:hypothetical protein